MSVRPLFAPCLLRRAPGCLLARAVSTNSAINRGIRRSREKRDFEDRPPRFDPDESGRPGPRLDSRDGGRTPYYSGARLDSPGERNRSPAGYSARPDSRESDYPSRWSPRLGPGGSSPESPDERNRSPTRYIPPSERSPAPAHTPRLSRGPSLFTPPAPISFPQSSAAFDPPAAGYTAWRPFARPSPRLDSTPDADADADWTPKPRRHIPKTDPASEWIYGTSVVTAALQSRTRKLLKLHIHTAPNRTPDNKLRDDHLRRLATAAGVPVVQEPDLGLLDSMSNSRPHNGYVLECLPLPKTPILSLGPSPSPGSPIALTLAQHHHYTGTPIPPDTYPSSIPCRDPTRYPFVLMLDEILDPGNLGAILRSAYYLGADAVTLSSRNCAPLSPVCLKAAAGAAELLPILEQNRSDKMITASSENGWTFYAGVPPPTKNQERRDRYVWSSAVAGALRKGPVCLVLGSEGEGLRPFLKKFVKYCVSLDKGPGTEAIVDSLNVSVASALLCSSFLKG